MEIHDLDNYIKNDYIKDDLKSGNKTKIPLYVRLQCSHTTLKNKNKSKLAIYIYINTNLSQISRLQWIRD